VSEREREREIERAPVVSSEDYILEDYIPRSLGYTAVEREREHGGRERERARR
jgi:hypothetical protein